jgi:diguanylate cyclase (GGDEF)-like protein
VDPYESPAGAGPIRRSDYLAIEIGLVLVAVFVLSFWLKTDGSAVREGILLGALALAGATSLRATARVFETPRAIWRALPFYCLLLFAGEGGRLLARSYGVGESSRWLVSGCLELAASFLLILALLRALCGSSLISWSLALLDLAMVGLAVSVPWLESYVLSRIAGSSGRELLPELVSPALVAVVVAAAVMTFQALPNIPLPSASFVLALGAGLAGDILIAIHLLAGMGIVAAQSAWLGRALLLAVAAILPRSSGRLRHQLFVRGASSRLTGLAILIAAAAASLAYAGLSFKRGDHLVGFVVTSVVSVLLALRLLVNARDRRQQSARLEQALREQEQLAVMDSLTGLYNRRFLDAELQLELDRSARTQVPVGVLLGDLDHFKQINDQYGHPIGDNVLREVARRLLGAVRNGDLVARYGGEEFVVLLPGGGKDQLREIGERCRRAFEEKPFPLSEGLSANVTISIGGACWPEDADTVRALIVAADAALYRAKEAGRNRIDISGAGVREEVTPIFAPPAIPASHLASAAATVSAPEALGGERGKPETAEESAGIGVSMERWAKLVARALGLDEDAQRRCAMATHFYDVGKSALPESILAKEGPLSPVEWELVQEHSERGAALVELLPGLEGVGRIIREHHERYDGRGYPSGKRDAEISTEARIVACCDAWKAMRRDRPYARARTVNEARAEMLAGRGTQFDPDVVMAFLMFDEGDFENAKRVLGPLPEPTGAGETRP